MLRQIAPVFFTRDIPATLAYYTSKLGFACLGTWQDPPGYAIVARDQQVIHFRCAEPPTAIPDKYANELLDAYLFVEDADALYAEYSAQGVELAAVPGHVAKAPSEFNALGGVLGIKCVGIFHEEVRVEQFVRVFVRIGGGRGGAAEMNHLLVARHDGVDRRVLPRPQTCEAKFACVIGERCGNVRGEEHRRNLTEHGPSLPHMAHGGGWARLNSEKRSFRPPVTSLPYCPSLILRGGVARAGSIFLCILDSSATSQQYPGARFL